MKRILVPTDFSANARNAVDYAVQLFEDEACEFILLHTFGAGNTTNMMVLQASNPAYEAALVRSQKGLKGLFDILSSSGISRDHTFDMVSRYGRLAETVKDLIEERNIDMIVMGTRGATGAKERWFGSNTVAVMESVFSCPILAVPESAGIKIPKGIVFPSSFKNAYKRKDLAPLLELAKKHRCTVRILHIGDREDPDEEQLDNKACLMVRLEGIKTHYHALTNIDTETAIHCFTESREDVDMIAFMNQKHSLFNTMLRKPVLKGLGHHTGVPLLVMYRS
ncbi:universal stress protein [Sinomicrobium weinanense]|uniref:Universal stress protein n=1 Tax=Sinomicrobium weinanense TaxID=2842200 RepID=A0A926Q1J3_9FLAO|nr:universal stress protein [Sinomicrobium weinanense]MBC9795802.1 universal stress protein [Sinomicrobium weinanense]MBU3121846.1 universal stress protein [Sinomicrobium weinanense]